VNEQHVKDAWDWMKSNADELMQRDYSVS
jgi:hypothetical protein